MPDQSRGGVFMSDFDKSRRRSLRAFEFGISRSDLLNLFKFIDWAMILPEGLKQAFWEELKAYEEERQMPYVTSVEQIGDDRGLQDGEETGVEKERRSRVSLQLEQKIGELSNRRNDRVNGFWHSTSYIPCVSLEI